MGVKLGVLRVEGFFKGGGVLHASVVVAVERSRKCVHALDSCC